MTLIIEAPASGRLSRPLAFTEYYYNHEETKLCLLLK